MASSRHQPSEQAMGAQPSTALCWDGAIASGSPYVRVPLGRSERHSHVVHWQNRAAPSKAVVPAAVEARLEACRSQCARPRHERQPGQDVPMRLCAHLSLPSCRRAPAHMMHGSTVTYRTSSRMRSGDSAAGPSAARSASTASNSACRVAYTAQRAPHISILSSRPCRPCVQVVRYVSRWAGSVPPRRRPPPAAPARTRPAPPRRRTRSPPLSDMKNAPPFSPRFP